MRTLVMRLAYIFLSIFLITYTKGADFGSYEGNQIELTPLHDAIIFSDIANIMNELEDSMNPSQNKNTLSDSDSGEDIEELLSEYEHYLDKAHKHRINYEKKSKGKNTVPLTRHEKYTKRKERTMNDDASSDYITVMKYLQTSFSPPLNLLISHNGKVNMDKKRKFTEFFSQPQTYEEFTRTKHELISPTCYCKIDQVPCKCNCNECFISTYSLPNINVKKYDNNNQNIFFQNYSKTAKYAQNKIDDGKLNIRIKIDVQLPKLTELGLIQNLNQDKTTEGEWLPSKEIFSTISLPFPYLNFPIPGSSKMYNNHNSSAIRKITIHKKKKSHFGSNKKHMGKKVMGFHSFNPDQPFELNYTSKNYDISNNSQIISMNSNNTVTEELERKARKPQSNSNNTITELPLEISNSSIKTIILTVNISKKADNDTNESLKLENNTETDFIDKTNKSTTRHLRLKRERLVTGAKAATQTNTNKVVFPKQNLATDNYTKDLKIFDKTLAVEMELLHWPAAADNVPLLQSKNITALILERESKKSKLNMTHDKIYSNHTKALEKAIFGEVDWNDIDNVAPVFMSFVGKYIRGVLTFCSQSICHSLKCAEKTCLHRICSPGNRLNHKGHCTGNNDTDSVAAMASIMDLPSNVVFDIVDILHDKMLGKMYGKATLCIISKCSTFVASKKLFQKTKCIYKDLSSSGHCPIVKNVKML